MNKNPLLQHKQHLNPLVRCFPDEKVSYILNSAAEHLSITADMVSQHLNLEFDREKVVSTALLIVVLDQGSQLWRDARSSVELMHQADKYVTLLVVKATLDVSKQCMEDKYGVDGAKGIVDEMIRDQAIEDERN